MENGWKLVASLWQGFAPNPDNLYNYNDPNCKNWSDVCDGSWKISNVKVVAESEVEDVAASESQEEELEDSKSSAVAEVG